MDAILNYEVLVLTALHNTCIHANKNFQFISFINEYIKILTRQYNKIICNSIYNIKLLFTKVFVYIVQISL